MYKPRCEFKAVLNYALKKKEHFEDMVEVYVSVFVNVLGFVRESAKVQECRFKILNVCYRRRRFLSLPRN